MSIKFDSLSFFVIVVDYSYPYVASFFVITGSDSLIGKHHAWAQISPSGFPSSVQFSLVQLLSRVELCDPMNRSMPGLPVTNPLESTQTHVHRVSDAIQPSHPLSSSSPPALNLSQHQGLFK